MVKLNLLEGHGLLSSLSSKSSGPIGESLVSDALEKTELPKRELLGRCLAVSRTLLSDAVARRPACASPRGDTRDSLTPSAPPRIEGDTHCSSSTLEGLVSSDC